MGSRLSSLRDRVRLLSAIDVDRQVFGARTHDYAFGPSITIAELEDLEARFGALPDDYRALLGELGATGAGPYRRALLSLRTAARNLRTFGLVPYPHARRTERSREKWRLDDRGTMLTADSARCGVRCGIGSVLLVAAWASVRLLTRRLRQNKGALLVHLAALAVCCAMNFFAGGLAVLGGGDLAASAFLLVLLVPLTSALVLLAAAATPAAAKEYADNDVEVAHDCATDPVIDVDGTNITLKATGVCTTVDVTGNDITLTANDVSKLSITGSDNKIFVVVTSSITVTGSDNVVKYEKAAAKAKRPKIRKVGRNNLVTKGKST